MAERVLRWWVRLDIEFESYYGPFEAKGHAEQFAAKEKCPIELLQDKVIDSGYLELTGGKWLAPTRYLIFRSGMVRPFSLEMLQKWVQREFR